TARSSPASCYKSSCNGRLNEFCIFCMCAFRITHPWMSQTSALLLRTLLLLYRFLLILINHAPAPLDETVHGVPDEAQRSHHKRKHQCQQRTQCRKPGTGAD